MYLVYFAYLMCMCVLSVVHVKHPRKSELIASSLVEQIIFAWMEQQLR